MQVIIDHGPYIVWISAADDFKDEDEEEVDEVEEALALYTWGPRFGRGLATHRRPRVELTPFWSKLNGRDDEESF